MTYITCEAIVALLFSSLPMLFYALYVTEKSIDVNVKNSMCLVSCAISALLIFVYLGFRLEVGHGGMEPKHLIFFLCSGMLVSTIVLGASLFFLYRLSRKV